MPNYTVVVTYAVIKTRKREAKGVGKKESFFPPLFLLLFCFGCVKINFEIN